jgi:hypothetical protein
MWKGIFWVTAFVALVADPNDARAAAPPRIEVAFALDATSSMGPYIDEARRRIQAISESLAEGDPKPDVRFALVAFRDKGDAFVTRVNPFTPKLGEMQGYLTATEAEGGGDTPESVLEGLSAAIHELAWSPFRGSAESDQVVRLLYLVGDAPAQHYPDSPSEAWLAREARKRGIVIHSIACGEDEALEATFEGLARHTEGRFFRLSEAAARVARAGLSGRTPTLAGTLTDTTRAYSSSVGVAYAEAGAQPIAARPLVTGAAPLGEIHSGLRGAHVRWVRDGKAFHALWTAHMSETPDAQRTPAPEVDFSNYQVLVLGGSDAGLELDAVEQRGDRRFARVRPAKTGGVRFVLVPNAGGK